MMRSARQNRNIEQHMLVEALLKKQVHFTCCAHLSGDILQNHSSVSLICYEAFNVVM